MKEALTKKPLFSLTRKEAEKLADGVPSACPKDSTCFIICKSCKEFIGVPEACPRGERPPEAIRKGGAR
jgi:hypothetical protein